MGQFSWFAQDTKRQIFNDAPKGYQTIHMVDPRDGTDYSEDDYDGYGHFGGRDFYELLADINKDLIVSDYIRSHKDCLFEDDLLALKELLNKDWKTLSNDELRKKRSRGISVWFNFVEPDTTARKMFGEDYLKIKKREISSPILIEDYGKWKEFIGTFPEGDPDQGWGYTVN